MLLLSAALATAAAPLAMTELPSLAGVWSGCLSTSGCAHEPWQKNVLFATRVGSGYGDLKENTHGPGAQYAFACLSTDMGHGAMPCPWVRANCTVSSSAISCATRSTTGAEQTISAPVTADGATIMFASSPGQPHDADSHWRRFTGEMSGLWCSHYDHCADVYVVQHNRTDDTLATSWDCAVSCPPSHWTFGTGALNRTATPMSVALSFHFGRGGKTENYSSALNSFSSMVASSKLGWRKTSPQLLPSSRPNIRKVHMVFMNHLDVGYTKDINVITNEYIHDYYPQVRKLADEMIAKPNSHKDRFTYITHPWLMSLFLDCPCKAEQIAGNNCSALSLLSKFADPLKCPSAEEIAKFTDSVQRGDIRWHGQPMNLQAENEASELFEAGLRMARRYDQRFFGTNKTIVVSDRDVVYVSRAIIPLLAKYGMRGLTIGANGGMFPPQTPKLHVWKDEATNTSVIVVYNPYSYGGYTKSTCAGPTGVSEVGCGDCIEAPNGVAMCSEFRVDNKGPPASVDEIEASLQAVRNEYPDAEVIISTFDDFVADVEPVKDQLPIVTEEAGDPWIYGAPSDILKIAQNREIQRQWVACLKAGHPECAYDHPAIQNMTRFLLKVPEHTAGNPGRYSLPGCGGSTVAHPHLPCWWDDYRDLRTVSGQALLKSQPYMHAASSYAEQRFMSNELAVAALEHANHPLATSIRAAITALSNVSAPSTTGYTTLSRSQFTAPIKLMNGIVLQLARDGSFASLKTAAGRADWGHSSLARFTWKAYNESDWAPFTYNWVKGHQEVENFCKPGSNNYSTQVDWFPCVQAVHVNAQQNRLIVQLTMPNTSLRYGAPPKLSLLADFTARSPGSSGGGFKASLQLRWFGQTPTMIGVSGQMLFAPGPALKSRSENNRSSWTLEKLASDIDPENVIAGGNQWNHGVFRGVEAQTVAGVMRVESLDSAVYNMMTADFPFGNALPAAYNRVPGGSPKGEGLPTLAPGSVFGVGAGLYNNLWNTNYALWYPFYDPRYCKDPLSCSNANALFRFELTFTPEA